MPHSSRIISNIGGKAALKIWKLVLIFFFFALGWLFLFGQAGFECGPPQCSSECSIRGLYCEGYDLCCGYCTNDGGKTKEYCCERCVSKAI